MIHHNSNILIDRDLPFLGVIKRCPNYVQLSRYDTPKVILNSEKTLNFENFCQLKVSGQNLLLYWIHLIHHNINILIDGDLSFLGGIKRCPNYVQLSRYDTPKVILTSEKTLNFEILCKLKFLGRTYCATGYT